MSRALPALALPLAALLAAAAPAAAQPTRIALDGRAGLTAAAVAPATASSRGAALPTRTVDRRGPRATVHASRRAALRSRGRTVELSAIRVRVGARSALTARVAGERRRLFVIAAPATRRTRRRDRHLDHRRPAAPHPLRCRPPARAPARAGHPARPVRPHRPRRRRDDRSRRRAHGSHGHRPAHARRRHAHRPSRHRGRHRRGQRPLVAPRLVARLPPAGRGRVGRGRRHLRRRDVHPAGLRRVVRRRRAAG